MRPLRSGACLSPPTERNPKPATLTMPETPPAAAPKPRFSLWCLLLLILVLYALDQGSKWYVVMNFLPPTPFWLDRVPVLTDNALMNFSFVRLHNNGVAFGFGNGTLWAPYVFLTIQLVAMVALIWFFRRGAFGTRTLRLAWALIMVGVLGNMTDRLVQGFFLPGAEQLGFWRNLANGYVVDFLDCSFPWIVTEAFPYGYHWPAFNVADSCVCIAATLFVVASIMAPSAEKESPSDDEGEAKA